MAKRGFIKSYRGPGGGFLLAQSLSKITLLDIIEAMEGGIFLNDCLIKKGFCPRDEVCPVHDVWKEAQKRFLDYLSSATLDNIAKSGRIKEKK
ncbi:MAG: Rrf2 family transcriptional regulator [Deltaproteobacteria bacterium]|nr:Rrf2 family transcriptional regulator [Deltaproteobacteria bacterium]MBI5892342.1 Rrf2 family transcriptional regulator [Deltaproteobacteria bacterium]